MRRLLSIAIIVLILILGFLTGTYMYKIKDLDDASARNGAIAKIEDECTVIAELDERGTLELSMTNTAEEKVSPNSILTIKKLYTKCNHIIEKSENIPVEVTNLNQQDFQKKYEDWEIQKFTAHEIVLYKEENDYCGEHYLLKDINRICGSI